MAVELSNITGTSMPVGASIKFPDGRSWTRGTDNGDKDWVCRYAFPGSLVELGGYQTLEMSDQRMGQELLCAITYFRDGDRPER